MDKLFAFFISPFVNSSSLATGARYAVVAALTWANSKGYIAATTGDIGAYATQVTAALIALYGMFKRTPDQLVQTTAALPEVVSVRKTDGEVVITPAPSV